MEGRGHVHGGVGAAHARESAGTKPHPETGVHAVHIHHHGDGAATTHTHHEDGSIESRDHASLDEAHDHAQSQLPSENASDHGEPDGDEYAESSSDDNYPGSMGSMS